MESDINDWILNKLSTQLTQFNNLPACPFAKEALINDKIVIRELTDKTRNSLSIKEHFIAELENYSYHWPNDKEVVVLGCLPHLINSNDLTDAVNIASKKFLSSRGYIALEDHPDNIEEVSGYVVNQGSYALILLQSASKLTKARDILERKGYYNNWDPKYKADVLSRA